MKRTVLALSLGIAACQPRPATRPSESALEAAIAMEPIFPVSDEGSAVVLARVAKHRVAFVADEDESAVHTVDLDAHAVIARTPVSGRPTLLLVTPKGLLVVRRDAASIAMLVAHDPQRPLRATFEMPTADEPTAIARAPGDSDHVWVASGWGRTLESFDLRTHAKTSSIPLLREPRALAISKDSAHAMVGYMAESGFGLVDLHTNIPSFLPVETEAIIRNCNGKHIKCGRSTPKRFARQTFAFARMTVDGKDTIVAPYTMVASGKPETVTGGYGSSGGVSPNVFDVATLDFSSQPDFSPEFHDASCALPRAAVTDPTSRRTYVACMGNQAVVEIGKGNSDGPFRVRARVEGGPSALAVDEKARELWVLRTFDRKLERLKLGPSGSFEAQVHEDAIKSKFVRPFEIALPHVEGLGLSSTVAEGRRLFHAADDDRISADGRACASCHPDGRDDGVTWPTPEGPRQTMFLAGRIARKTPYGWSATHATLAAHVRTTMHNINGVGLDDASLSKLMDYLGALPEPPHGAHPLTEVEVRGREIFEAKACGSCHGDGHAHDVATAIGADKKKSFVAPTLHLVGGSAPYFHDGRFPTLSELLRNSESMSSTKSLSGEDLTALEAYLRTL